LQAAQQKLRALTGAELKACFYDELHPMLKAQHDQAQAQLKYARKQRRQFEKDTAEYEQWQATADRWRNLRDRIDDSIKWLDYCIQQDRPFHEPIYWAGFICSGLA
jgi:CHAT domain-containing protein